MNGTTKWGISIQCIIEHKKEWSPDACYDMGEPWKYSYYAERRPMQKAVYCGIPCIRNEYIGKSIQAEVRLVPRGWGRGRMGSECQWYGVSLGGLKTLQNETLVMVALFYEYTQNHQLYTFNGWILYSVKCYLNIVLKITNLIKNTNFYKEKS